MDAHKPPKKGIVARAREAVEAVRARERAGEPPTAEQVRIAWDRVLDAQEEVEIQAVLLDYVRRARDLEGLDDLQRLADEHLAGQLHLPLSREIVAARARRLEGPDLLEAWRAGSEADSAPFPSWALCEALCEASLCAEAEDSGELARAAVEMAELLSRRAGESPGEASIDRREASNLLAYALAHEGNAWRRQGDLHRAGKCFARMSRTAVTMRHGVEWDDDLQGYCSLALALEASYLRAVRRLPEAIDRLVIVLELLAGLGPQPPRSLMLVRVLIALAKALEDSGALSSAIELLLLCRRQFDDDLLSRPYLRYCLHLNLAGCLAKEKRTDEARDALDVAAELCDGIACARERVRLLWVESRLQEAEGDLEAALRSREQARQRFIAAGHAYDVALVSLELAAFYADRGDTSRVMALVGEMLPLFAAQGIDRETFAALGFLQVALAREARDAAALRTVWSFLARSRWDASQVFHPPWGTVD